MNILNGTNGTFGKDAICDSETSSGGSSSSSGTFAVGVIIAVLGSTGEQLGLTLWKLAENRVQKRRDERRKAELENEQLEDIGSPLSPPESLVVHLDETEMASRNTNLSHDDATSADTGTGRGQSPKISGAATQAGAAVEENEGIMRSEHDTDEDRSDRAAKHKSWIQEDKPPEMPSSPTSENSLYIHDKSRDQSPSSGTVVTNRSNLSHRIVLLKLWCIEKEALMCLIAFATFAGGNGLNFVALGLIQESIVTLIGAWALVINIATAKFLLSEDLSYLDGISVLMIIVGITLSILGSQHTATQWCHSYIFSSFEPVISC
jgi:hypothetical protein